MLIITLSTLVFCYTSVLREIRRVMKDNLSITNSHNNFVQLSNIERKTFLKVLTYILVFIIQYIPVFIYDFFAFLRVK